MPEFILPAEADRCEHCGGALYCPPKCCDAAATEYVESSRGSPGVSWDEIKATGDGDGAADAADPTQPAPSWEPEMASPQLEELMETRSCPEDDRDELRRFAEFLARRKDKREGKTLPPLTKEQKEWLGLPAELTYDI